MGLISRVFGHKPVAIQPDYPALWARCNLDEEGVKKAEIFNALKIYTKNFERYNYVSLRTSIPSFLIFCLHYKESGCNFDAVLHNGEKLSDVNKYGTRLVPKGRGKGLNWSWEAAAVDALMLEKDKWGIYPNWTYIPFCLEFAEKYNGLGHRTHGELSPYVWSYTNNHDETGNYSYDGKYGDNIKIKSAGVAALYKGALDAGALK